MIPNLSDKRPIGTCKMDVFCDCRVMFWGRVRQNSEPIFNKETKSRFGKFQISVIIKEHFSEN